VKFLRALPAALCLLASPALSHHTADALDLNRTVKLTGTVKQFQWTSPYTMLSLVAAPQRGKAQEWLLDLNSPGSLSRKGWNAKTLKPGDRLTVTIHPLKDGQPGGRAVSVVLPNGTSVAM
jgi:hypothetical protein